MVTWLEALIISLAGTTIIITILCFIIRRRFFSNKVAITESESTASSSATELEHQQKTGQSYQLFHRGSSARPSYYFNWADHPTLITDAVENGWSRFTFTSLTLSSSSVRSSLLNSLRVKDEHNPTHNNSNQVEESWEIGTNSAELMQQLHFNVVEGLISVRMALPLPGPNVVGSFPQEAYFEITVMGFSGKKGAGRISGEGLKAKLLAPDQSDSDTVVQGRTRKRQGDAKMSIGLSVGGSLMSNKLPGTYPASIGFHSDGSVFLAGMKLVFESQKEDWAQTGKVIGCGFDPRLKKAFFTVESELVHVVNCKSEEFGMPLYPVLATNADVILLVNLGQDNFSYPPANAQRTPNPCFVSTNTQSSPGAIGDVDSRELFSMGFGRLDSEWQSATTRSTSTNVSHSNNTCNMNNRTNEHDEESEADELFDIVLDSTEH